MSAMSAFATDLDLFHTGNLPPAAAADVVAEVTRLGVEDLLDAERWWAINGRPDPSLLEPLGFVVSFSPPRGYMPPPNPADRRA